MEILKIRNIILTFLCRKKRERLYDILSIVSISFYASKISLETISFSNVDILKTSIYIFSAIWIYIFSAFYGDYLSLHDEVKRRIRREKGFKSDNSKENEENVENTKERSYDSILEENVKDKSDYIKKITIKLWMLIGIGILNIILFKCYNLQ